MVPPVVRGSEPLDGFLGAQALAQELEPAGPVTRVGVRLGRDRADSWSGPRDEAEQYWRRLDGAGLTMAPLESG